MLKDATYKEKFSMLRPWLASIVESVKKDLKNEHLKKDWQFCKQYLPGKNVSKVTVEEMVDAYGNALENSENAEALAEFISNRWLLKNCELYNYFEANLSRISPNFTELETIDAASSREIVRGAVEQYGAMKTYLFSVINSVVFPKEVYSELGQKAETDEERRIVEERTLHEKLSLEELQKDYEQQIARLVDKYEKKLTGMQKKYAQDTESLKKQIINLQRKMAKS